MSLPSFAPTTIEAMLLVQELEERGVTITATGRDRLRLSPHALLTDNDKERVKAHKANLLESLGYKEEVTPASPASPATQTSNPDTYGDSLGGRAGGRPDDNPAASLPPRAREEAEELGLVAHWSFEFGYISIHDPTTGEWHDLPTKDASDWAKSECFKRRELRKRGVRRLLTCEEMEEVYAQAAVEQEFQASLGAVTHKGIVYEDYIREEDN